MNNEQIIFNILGFSKNYLRLIENLTVLYRLIERASRHVLLF
jgi:hypothetical protein